MSDRRSPKTRARYDFLVMPVGEFRGFLISDIPEVASDHANWFLNQPWFRQRYPDEAVALAYAIKLWSDPGHRQRVIDERRRYLEKREAARLEQEARWHLQWLDQHKLRYEPRGIWPLGKYKGQPLAVVARDDYYCRWFKATAYAKVNPGLAADLQAAVEQLRSGKIATEAVEFHAGDCTL